MVFEALVILLVVFVFILAAGCLAVCCYAMILSYYCSAVSWYCNEFYTCIVRSLSSNCYFVVHCYTILLSYDCIIVLSYC